MALTLVLFALSAAAIYFASEYFVNGVEWVGRRLGLAETATGTVLAAIGTALPESAVTFFAVAFGTTVQQQDIGIGAALGGPLVLACIGYPVVALALLVVRWRRRDGDARVHCDAPRLARDQLAFLAVFVVKVGLGVVAFAIKPWLGWAFFAVYVGYVAVELRRDESAPPDRELVPLKLSPHRDPGLWLALLQTLAAMIVVAVAARVFVLQLAQIGDGLGLQAQLVALFLSPIATELPELFNAIIWVRQRREQLALANLSGSMMAQATIPAGLGIIYTPWLLSTDLVLAGMVTVLATLWLFLQFHGGRPSPLRMIPALSCYALFVAVAFLLL